MSWGACYIVRGGASYLPEQGNPFCCTVVLYAGEGSEREQCHLLSCSALPPLSVTSLASHKQIVPFQVLIPKWVALYMFWDPMGLSNKLSCEAGSFSHHCNIHRFLQSVFLRLYFPALEPWVAWFVSLFWGILMLNCIFSPSGLL